MTFVEKLTLVSSFAALISAAAALFASIAQVFIARSSNLYAYRLESDKLFFHAKVEAYQQFFQATDRCMNLLDRTSAGDLLARCSYAISSLKRMLPVKNSVRFQRCLWNFALLLHLPMF